jgi:methylmalonyl-CoA mutase N-terminal domain/subunit
MSSFHSESDVSYFSANQQIKQPPAGEYPFTRGIYQEMYLARPWTIRQYSGFGTPSEANQRLKQLIASGMTGISIAFDLPTQMGLDSDSSLARFEAGIVGVSIDTLADMRDLLANLNLNDISTSMTINAPAAVILLMYEIVANENGASSNLLQGTIQNDVLKEYIARGTQIFDPRHSIRLTRDIFEYCTLHLPKWNSISISGYHMSEAGATAVQELAFTFANAIAYVDAAIEAGLDVDEFGKKISFFFAAKTTLLEEVAKFRAARNIWATIMKERYGANNPKAQHLRFHTQTAGVQLTSQQPLNNLTRVTVQALAAIFGGTQSLHTNAYDEALSLPGEESANLALRTQQILMNETDLTKAIDPFAGSYLIENMTEEIINLVEKELSIIEKMGGAVAAIEQNYQRGMIEDNAFKIQMEIEFGQRKVVGLNFQQNSNESEYRNGFIRPLNDNSRLQKLAEYRLDRDLEEWNTTLDALSIAAQYDKNLLPVMKRAIMAGATLGEICGVLKKAWGNT